MNRAPNNLVRALLVHRDRADASTILAALTGGGESIEAELLHEPDALPAALLGGAVDVVVCGLSRREEVAL